MLILLLGCDAAKVELGTGEASELGERLAALEAETADLRTELDALTVRADELDGTVSDLQARLLALGYDEDEGLQADLDALEGRVGVLEDLVEDLGGASVAGSIQAADYSEPVARGGGTGSSWEAMTSADLEIEVNAGSTVIAWCTATTSDTDSQIRMRIANADRSYTDTAEAAGDGVQPLSYPGEIVTVMGLWRPEQEGTLYVGCEGRYASPSEVHILGIVL